jgi:hypothetical protein
LPHAALRCRARFKSDIFGGSRRPVEALEACSDAMRVRTL